MVGGRYLADLLPLPMTEEALEVVCRHVQQTQEALRRPILLENPSSYMSVSRIRPFRNGSFSPPSSSRTGCGMLCDLNNIFVSASNHGWDPLRYLDALPGAADR